MPTYAYNCLNEGHHVEVHQSFDDAPLTTCPECGGPVRKQFSSVGVVFKGSGFYRTDSRDSSRRPASTTPGKSESSSAPSTSSSSSSPSSSSASSGKTSAAPAKAAAS